MNGAFASLARRRAISVLPTPVGPIIRMFFGVISLLSGSATCDRRQRLRSAIATARFASSCPTMCLSSSWTTSLGVIDIPFAPPVVCVLGRARPGPLPCRSLQLLARDLPVRVDADVARDRQRLLDDIAGLKLRVVDQRLRRCLRVGAAGEIGRASCREAVVTFAVAMCRGNVD